MQGIVTNVFVKKKIIMFFIEIFMTFLMASKSNTQKKSTNQHNHSNNKYFIFQIFHFLRI